jgi:hypothetical protein
VSKEAFALMTYEADDGSETELIWNSRDGVTPFVITLRSGKEARHVRWNEDRYLPEYRPPLGSRIFVDLTPALARKSALANARRFWDDPGLPASQSGRWASVEDMADDLAESYMSQPGAPTLIEVTG